MVQTCQIVSRSCNSSSIVDIYMTMFIGTECGSHVSCVCILYRKGVYRCTWHWLKSSGHFGQHGPSERTAFQPSLCDITNSNNKKKKINNNNDDDNIHVSRHVGAGQNYRNKPCIPNMYYTENSVNWAVMAFYKVLISDFIFLINLIL